MTPQGIKYARMPLLFVTVSLLGCPPRVAPKNPTVQLVEWMLGREERATPQSPDAILDTVPKDKLNPNPAPKPPPKPKRSENGLANGTDTPNVVENNKRCIRASSFVPAPQDDRFFLAVDGGLHVMHARDKTTTPLQGLAADVIIYKLAATRVVPEGVELLAWVKVEGKNDTEMHTLVVNASGIVRSGIADIRVERIEDLLSHYTVPRCTTNGTACLEVSNEPGGATYLDVRSRATGSHAPPTTLAAIPGLIDATWTPKNDGAVYVLRHCDPNASADQTAPPE